MKFDTERINRIKDTLRDADESIAVAESVTAGFLQAALASADQAMEYFEGGMTAYNIGQKCRQLNVNPIQAIRCNCVSEQTAGELARGACERFLATWGIGVTGYATPDPASGGSVFAFAAFSKGGNIRHIIRIEAGERRGADAQLHYVQQILEAFETLVGRGG